MALDKIFGNGDLDKVADSVFSAVSNSTSEIKAMQKRKAAENVQIVVQALKKIESDLQDKYDGVTTGIEKRVASIKNGKDGQNGINGKDGRDGRPGRDGAAGQKGNDGLPGRNGIDGMDGVSVTNAFIDFDGSLIINLSSGRDLNVGEVVAPDLAEKIKVITNGGGTSQQVLDTLISLQNQINNLIPSQTGNAGKFLTTDGTNVSWAQVAGGLTFEGTWNATTNTPTLASGVGVNGEYYITATAGTTNLDGITDWEIGDWLLFNGTVWQKIDQSNLVTSVNGQVGVVSLTTTDIAEGTNLYYTDVRARGAISAGTGISYDSATGVVTNAAPDQTVSLTGAGTTSISGTYPNFTVTSADSTVGTVTSVSGTGTVSGISLSGTVTSSGNLTLGGSLDLSSPPTIGNTAPNTATFTTVNATTFDTNVAAAGLTLSGTSLAADGTDANIDVIVNPKGTGGLGVGGNTTGVVAGNTITSKFCVKHEGPNQTGGFVHVNNTTAASGAGIFACRSRGTLESPTIVQNNDTLSTITFAGNDGVDLALAARISVEVDGTPGSNDMPGRMVFLTTPDGSQTPTEALRIDSAQNVKMSKADIDGGTIDGTTIGATTASTGAFTNLAYTGTLTGGTGVVNLGSGQLFKAASGNVGIGTSSPATALHVSGSAVVSDRLLLQRASASLNLSIASYWNGSGSPLNGTRGDIVAIGNTGGDGLVFVNGDTERMRIDSAGNVGIGTSSPGSKLDINRGSAGLIANFTDGVNTNFQIGTSSLLATIGPSAGSTAMAFKTGDAERMRIDSSGNLLVGTTVTSFSEKMTVTSGANKNSALFFCNHSNDNTNVIVRHNRASGGTSATMLDFLNDSNASVGTIRSTGSVTSYNTSSDYRLKENIAPMTGALARVAALKPVIYTWKSTGQTDEGFIAHELQEVCPSAVSGEKDAVNEDGSIKPQGIDTSFLVATLTAALQELKAINDAQAQTIESLKARLDAANI